MGLLDRIAAARDEHRFNIDPWLSDYLLPNQFSYNGNTYPFSGLNQTYLGGTRSKEIANTLPGYMAALRGCPPAFAAQLVRAKTISGARFIFRNNRQSRSPGRLFGSSALVPLERPWMNATTGELLTRMEWDAGVTGNAYVTNRTRGRLRVLRPDWVIIVYGSEQEPDAAAHALDGELIGYVYINEGLASGNKPTTLLPDEVAHWSPEPDPENAGIGMSWITPAVREIQGDRAASEHKLKFFENAATANMVVKGITAASKEQFDEIVDAMEAQHAGIRNAYKTLYLAAGADATVVGANLAEMDFKGITGSAEPLALDTPVPTPTGWTTMGEIRPGDQVIGRDGRPANVVSVSPVHMDRECYRVTLKDRTSIVADASHIWAAVDRNSANRTKEKKYTTRELFDLVNKGYPVTRHTGRAYGHRIALPVAPIVELPSVDLLVDPYVLGVWLGDGQTAGAAICGATEDLKFIRAEIEERGYTTTQWQTAPDKVDVIGLPGGLLAALRALGVLGNKHVPLLYRRASVEQRLDLLRGLMDTDGTVAEGRGGGCTFTSKFESLARQVAELARSLGYRTTLSYYADARSRTGGTWKIHFRVHQDRIPFLLPRKVDRCVGAGDPFVTDHKSIVSVEPVPSVPVRCITVDTEDHLFLAGEGFTPTHNTRIAMLSRVHPVILAASEGLQGSSLNAGNFSAARRIWADTWIYPTLQDLAASLASLIKVPSDAELWTDITDMPILREDAKDAADIEQVRATTITMYVREGFTADSAVAAVDGQDVTLLKHSGLPSVQVQRPGTTVPAAQPTAGDGGVGPKVQPALRSAGRDEPDEATWALIVALDELCGEESETRGWDPAKHLRIPAGQPGGGRFRSMVDRIKEALQAGDGVAALKDFDHDQLRRAGKARGLSFPRGASREHIAAALVDDLKLKRGRPHAAKKTTASTVKAVKAAAPARVVPPPLTGVNGHWWTDHTEDTGWDNPVPVRDLTVNTWPGAHDRYTVGEGWAFRVDGVSYLVERSEQVKDEAAARRQAELVLASFHASLPPEAARYQQAYHWLANPNPADGYWAQRYNVPGLKSWATAADGATYVWGGVTGLAYDEYLRHELGHNISTGVRRDGLHDMSPAWGSAASGTGARGEIVDFEPRAPSAQAQNITTNADPSARYPAGVTRYGQSSQAEDYAESISMYLSGPIGKGRLTRGGPVVDVYFRDMFPKRAAVLDQIFPRYGRAQREQIASARR